jgi:lysozyme family protein
MNKRIKELADKIWAEEYWDKPNTDKLLPAQLNRFAELIVQECAEFVRYKAEKAMSQEILYVGNDLLTHFGVE